MKKKPGLKTAEFGLWLTEQLKDHPEYQVYYDHGDPEQHDNVAVIKAFLGDRVTRDNKLADVDVLVANQENEILLVIEIEESPISPKTLLGDVFASLLSSRFAVNLDGIQNYFQVTPMTKFFVTGFIPNIKINKPVVINKIQNRINEIQFTLDSVPAAQIQIVIDNNMEGCLAHLREIVLNDLIKPKT